MPCREEHQFLMVLNKEKNLEIIGLNYKDNSSNAKNFLNELKESLLKYYFRQRWISCY